MIQIIILMQYNVRNDFIYVIHDTRLEGCDLIIFVFIEWLNRKMFK